MTARLLDDPDVAAGLMKDDPETHLYGLADLEEPLWSRSRWFHDGDAAVGVIGLGDGHFTGYAMSRVLPQATLDLLTQVQSQIPSGSTVTGAIGLTACLDAVRGVRPLGVHHRMILGDFAPVDSSRATPLGIADLEALTDLHESAAGMGFFLPAMLKRMPFYGIWEDDMLVASAGCHVVSKQHGVAAVGAVVTRPAFRGGGLGTAVTSALCETLSLEYRTVGLNVAEDNQVAIDVYEKLGFANEFPYEEVVLD